MKLFLKNLLFTILVPGTVSVYLPLLIARGKPIASIPFLLALGALLLVFGTAIYLWTVWDFATSGRGTPLPLDAPKKLVVRGLYRYTRNPMYLGVLSVVLGWAGVFADAWLLVYALFAGMLVHIFVVTYEEPKLKELFGAEYEKYQAEVARWIPRLPGGKT